METTEQPTPRRFNKIWYWIIPLAFAVLIYLATLPLPWQEQAIFGTLLILSAHLFNRISPSRTTTLLLLFVSCFCSLRYAFFRYSETWWNIRTGWSEIHLIDLFFVLVLLAAETYAFLILLLGVFQTARPLKRRPQPLLGDPETWPQVDIFIPTYNEPLEVVTPTVLAALSIDWPADKLKVYILDDGRRPDFQQFAEDCGATYFTRLDNAHAKAGNINNALRHTGGEFIAIFDCDHIPTRSFLQMTMGWFLSDPKLAMLQTPHHYYSPDPFERNLNVFRRVPNEGALFYGVIQDGNDFWNATFFCGSCAVIRRTALEEIGGVAVETVTEDAHTALRLQCRGWNTAYINLTQAAGLATNKLSDHIGQRIRWARGMIQILRVDNPLFARGLKFPQRLCYLNAMMHFLFAGPRLVFLSSPLVYLILHRYNVFGYLPAILSYAFPHLVVVTASNSRVQGRHRHSFWNELYEIVLAPYIFFPTLLALINPKWGKFNVTAKKSLVEGSYFDWYVARPYLVLLLLNLVGVVMGVRQYIHDGSDPSGVLTVNLFWATCNVLLLGGALAVAQEGRQLRSSVRVTANLPMQFFPATGAPVAGRTINLSRGGLLIRLAKSGVVSQGETAKVALSLSEGEFFFPVRVVDAWGSEIRLAFEDLDLAHQAALVQVIYSRADTWIDWSSGYQVDRPTRSLATLFRISLSGLGLVLAAPFRRKPRPAGMAPNRAAGPAAAAIILPLLLFFGGARPLRSAPQEAPQATRPLSSAPSFRDTHSLTSLGSKQPVLLRGSGSRSQLYFGVPVTKFVLQGTLSLSYRYALRLKPDSQIRVFLNGSPVATVPLSGNSVSNTTASHAELSLPSDLFITENTLAFEFVGSCAGECGDANGEENGAWASIEPSTELRLSGTLLPLSNSLGLLPTPFFDLSTQRIVDLPFVLDSHVTPATLQAAWIAASWFGVKADYRGIHFPVRLGEIPSGDTVVVTSSNSNLATLINVHCNSCITFLDNPRDPYGKLLAIVGSSDREILNAARAFALEMYARDAAVSEVENVELPLPRKPYDAPRWLRTDHDVQPAAGLPDGQLQVTGNGQVNLYFRLPPDLHYGSRDIVPFYLKYRCSRLARADVAEVRVQLNGTFVAARPIPINSSEDVHTELVGLPVAALYPRNTLTVEFSLDRPQTAPGMARTPQAAVLRSSLMMVSALPHFVEMPRLDLFSSTGFPFTRMADLSETVAVLPASPTPDEISLFLTNAGFMGAQTGYPGIQVSVLQGNSGPLPNGKDILVFGTFEDQPLLRQWSAYMVVRPEGNRFRLADPLGLNIINESLPWTRAYHERRILDGLLQGDAPVDGIVEGFRSPLNSARSVIAIAAANQTTLESLAGQWAASANAYQIRGRVSVFSSGQFRSFEASGRSYHVGELGVWLALQYWCRRYYWVWPLMIFACIWFLTILAREWLEAHAVQRLKVSS